MPTFPLQPLYKIPESVLVVIHTADLQVLLIERADEQGAATGYWQSVTGSLDTVDEPLEEACRREVWEETGIDMTQPGCELVDWHLHNIYDIYPRWQHRYAPGVTRNTEHVFSLCVPQDIRVTLSPREHVASQWLPYLDAADACSSASNSEAILLLSRLSREQGGVLLPK
jgi:dihydroneopterin triphosphate diphosphatase